MELKDQVAIAYKTIIEGRFVKCRCSNLNSKAYRLDHRGDSETVLNYLKASVIRYRQKGDLGLYDRFYKRGYLVSTKSLRDLAADFGYKSKCQMLKIINKLIANGELYTATVNVGRSRPQNVYIVGVHNNHIANNRELYFTDIKYSLDNDIEKYLDEFSCDKKLFNLDSIRSQIET